MIIEWNQADDFNLFLKKHLLVKLAYWICLCSSVGFGIDSILQFSGVIIYQSHPWPWFAPPWIFALWLNFSVVCFAMQDFLLKYHRYMSICAAFGFPIAYLGGIQFGVAQFSAPILGPLILSGIWAIVFPLLVLKCPNEKM